MIKIENTEVRGWEAAIRGMRNPMNSWGRMDSHDCPCGDNPDYDCPMAECGDEPAIDCSEVLDLRAYCIGENDYDLMSRLARGGSCHAKYRRFIDVTMDITAPLYWWKEFDTYKVGTVANSCSTMHKIASRHLKSSDFSVEYIKKCGGDYLFNTLLDVMNDAIDAFNNFDELKKTGKLQAGITKKDAWYTLIQLLPSSYNQRRTVKLNYEVLANIYQWRRGHKLDEWNDFCKWIESLPYSDLITGGKNDAEL